MEENELSKTYAGGPRFAKAREQVKTYLRNIKHNRSKKEFLKGAALPIEKSLECLSQHLKKRRRLGADGKPQGTQQKGKKEESRYIISENGPHWRTRF